MKKAINRMTILIGCMLIIALAMSIAVFSNATDDNSLVTYADADTIVISGANVGATAGIFEAGTGTKNDPYRITTDGEFVKAMKEGKSQAYYQLEKDVVFQSSSPLAWNPVETFQGTFLGNNKTITVNASFSYDSDNYGLFKRLSGSIIDLNYIFNGSLERGNNTSNYGSLVGFVAHDASVSNSRIVLNGGITLECESDGHILAAGGVVGRNEGTLGGLSVEMDCSIVAHNKARNSQAYAGGIVGYNSNVIEDSTIKIYGSVTAMNEYENLLNSSSSLYAAGGVIGYNEGGSIKNTDMDITVAANGSGLKATYGAVGGVIGYSTGELHIQESIFRLNGEIQVTSQQGGDNLHAGGLVGQLDNTQGEYKDNVIFVNFENDDMIKGANSSVLIGSGNFFAWNKGGAWIVHERNANVTLPISSTGIDYNKMVYLGNGRLEAEISSNGGIIFKGIPVKSPLYGWMSDSVTNTKLAGTTGNGNSGYVDPESGYGEYYPAPGLYGQRYEALFLKQELNEAGDLNVLADFVAGGGSWEWLNIKVINDLNATGSFDPIGTRENPFRGLFDGQGYTITYSKEVRISGLNEAGIFGVNEGIIKNLNIIFGGQIYAKNLIVIGGLFFEEIPQDTDVSVGTLVGVNRGMIESVYITNTNSSLLRGEQVSPNRFVAVGGMVGYNEIGAIGDNYRMVSGKIDNAEVIMQGKIHSVAGIHKSFESDRIINRYGGGLIGLNENNKSGISDFLLSNVSVLIEGEVATLDYNNDNVPSYTAGMVGYNIGDLYIQHGCVSINSKSAFSSNFPSIGSQSNGTDNRGAVAAYRDPSRGLDLRNFWVILDDIERVSNGLRVFGNDSSNDESRSENKLFVRDGMVKGKIDNNQIIMQVPIGAGEVFSGWFGNIDENGYYSDMLTDNVHDNIFSPDINMKGEKVYTRVISSIVTSIEDLNAIANFTNQGNDFSGISFNLGANLSIYSSNYEPIGFSETTPFNGSFNGGNLTITINYMRSSHKAIALFGYTGYDSHIYSINIVVTGEISSSSAEYAAALVAVNNGMIGVNSPTQKTTIDIDNGIIRGNKAAALVAENNGVIQNVEINIQGQSGIFAQSMANADMYAASVIAINLNIARNILVNISSNSAILAEGSRNIIAGGAVALNKGELHSVVVVLNTSNIEALSTVPATSFTGAVLGKNESSMIGYTPVSKLWMVVEDDEIDISINPEGRVEYNYQTGANKLEIHGKGAIQVNIEANSPNDPINVGGSIIFKSVPSSESGNRTFYGYMYDKNTGDLLGPDLGISDYIFTPEIEVKGKTIYSVFALSKINSINDLNQVAIDVNDGINPRIVYNLNKSLIISGNYIPIGTEDNPFFGVFKGNDNKITIASGANNFNGLFGVVADNGIIEYIRLDVAENASQLSGEVVAGIAHYNYGTIKNVDVTLYKGMRATSSVNTAVAGGIAAYNYGAINSASVYLQYDTRAGVTYDGSIYSDDYAGGIAGINEGTIGSNALQDIRVFFDVDSKIQAQDASGGIAGKNVSGSLIQNAFMTINGSIITTQSEGASGGIVGINEGNVESIYILIEGQGMISSLAYVGMIAGVNSGTIGRDTGNSDNINIGIYKSLSSANNIGGVVGWMNDGLITNTVINIQGNISGNINAGGAVGMVTGGLIERIDLTLSSGYRINGTKTAGGLVGLFNNESIYSSSDPTKDFKNISLNIAGTIACLTIDNQVVNNSYAGGVVGESNARMENVLIDLQNDILADTKGTIAGVSNAITDAVNVWVLASNRITTDTSYSVSTGFNSLKVVGEAVIRASFDENYVITFRVISSATPFFNWYSDISKSVILRAGVVITSQLNYYVPDRSVLKNCNYHISFHRLDIENVEHLNAMARAVNQNDYFYNVKFNLTRKIEVSVKGGVSESVIPIGTELNPFNGIFDGKGYSIVFNTGTSIGAVSHSGLFGYTAPNSKIMDFVLDIKEGVVIGGQSSNNTGALVGYSQGSLENVLVNLASKPRASSSNRIGGVVGYQTNEKTAINTWLIVHNAMVLAASSRCDTCGINTMNIIGQGALNAELAMQDSRFMMSIASGSVVGWFKDVSNQELLTDTEGRPLGQNYRPLIDLKDQHYAVSFIKLEINNYEELKEFSANIRTFSGFEGVQFLLKADIIINDNNFIPVGTKNNPFSGIFEGQGHKISFAGISLENFDYPGLFGYIDRQGVIKDLIVVSNISEQANKIGGQNSVYSGLVASYSDGLFNNVVAEIADNTQIFCVNKAGALVGAIGDNFQAIKSWVVIDYKNNLPASGVPEDDINVLYVAGNGSVRIEVDSLINISFIADADDAFYAFIEGDNGNVIDGLNKGDDIFYPTNEQGVRFTALFIITNITSYQDLIKLSTSINQGLNYPIEYTLYDDIVIDDNSFIPIGGLVGNNIVQFNGQFNGLGNKVTIAEGVIIKGVYAGIFGYISNIGEVKNLQVAFEGQIGDSNTLYAGPIAGYNEGIITNLVVHAGKFSNVQGLSGEAGFMGLSEGTIVNSWVLNYNARRLKIRNDEGRDSGLNSLTILGAGELSISFTGSNYDVSLTVESGYSAVEWYDGNKEDSLEGISNIFRPAKSLTNKIYYVSFLNTDIDSYEALKMLSTDVNTGYNYYGITFNLIQDIVITGDDFLAIGSDNRQFIGSFNGGNNRIIVDKDAAIVGKYAGIFGTINEYSIIRNLIIEINGTLGNSNSSYTGAFAYNEGRLENVIVEGYDAQLFSVDPDENRGLVIGYDKSQNIYNTWGVVASYNNIPVAGVLGAGVNRMKVVGASRINVEILSEDLEIQVGDEKRTITENRVKFSNIDEETIDISGWYVNYATLSPISNHLGVGSVADENNTYYPSINLRDIRYEVIIIKQIIESQDDLNVLANDINIGGYDFNNLTFILGNDIELDEESIIIGTEKNPFRGILEGNGYSIIINGDKGLFAYNLGTIKNLIVIVNGNIINDSQAAAIAYVNRGSIEGCSVKIRPGASITGRIVGTVAAENYGTIKEHTTVTLDTDSELKGLIIGGAVGVSEGDIYDVFISINGSRLETISGQESSYVGGAIGFMSNGVTKRVEIELDGGTCLNTFGNDAYAGGFVGRNRATIQDSVVFVKDAVILADGNGSASGLFAGATDRNMKNSWVVNRTSGIRSVGSGYQSINQLTIYGNGSLNVEIDMHGNIIFSKDADFSSSVIDGWYYVQGATVGEDPSLGGVSSDNNSYTPSKEIMGRNISVVFINTEIRTINDLMDLADSVNSGMSANDIVFKLMNNIEINQDLLSNIGTLENNFNYAFDGDGYTITIKNSNKSVFGYIGHRGRVYNLNISIVGVLGENGTVYTGGIAAHNEGLISNCDVVVEKQGQIIGNTVGGVAGVNYSTGEVKGVSVRIEGTIQATGEAEIYRAGGIIGRNQGLLSSNGDEFNSVMIEEGGKVYAYGIAQSYVGGAVAQNAGTLSQTIINTKSGSILEATSTGPYNCFAGGIAGANTGTIKNSLIYAENLEVKATGIRVNYVGMIVASNISTIKNTVAYVSKDSVVVGDLQDIAVGDDRDHQIFNTWIISTDKGVIATNASVNTIIADESTDVILTLDLDKFYQDYIEFTITEQDGYFAVYDDITQANNVYLNDIVFNVFTPNDFTQGMVANARNSNTISSGSELKAFSAAVNAARLTNASITLESDIVIEGAYIPVGTLVNAFIGVLDGQGHSIIIADGVDFVGELASVFGYNSGTIKNLVVLIQGEMNGTKAAGLVYSNLGFIENIVIDYSNGSFSGDSEWESIVINNIGEAYNVWTISNDMSYIPNEGKIIYINGNGKVDAIINGDVISFAAVVQPNVHFAGWWLTDSTFISGDAVETNSNLNASSYIMEYINLEITQKSDLDNLSRIIKLGYNTIGLEFIQSNNLVLTGDFIPIGTISNAFEGTYNGNGYRIVLDNMILDCEYAGLFGNIGLEGKVQNLILELGVIGVVDYAQRAGLAAISNGTIEDVVVIGSKNYNLVIGQDNGSRVFNVWVVTNDSNQAIGADAGVIVKSGIGEIDITIDNGSIIFTAITSQEMNSIFIGWYEGNSLATHDNTICLNDGDTARFIDVVFITSLISEAVELEALAMAVSLGFNLEEYEIKLNGDIVIDSNMIIGNLENAFAGIFDGQGYKLTLNYNYDNEIVSLFPVNEGVITNLVIEYMGDLGGMNTKQLAGVSIINKGLIANVFVNILSDINSELVAGIALDSTDGDINNSWSVANNDLDASNLSDKGNTITSSLELDIIYNDGVFQVEALNEDQGLFVVWYEFGEALFEGVECEKIVLDTSKNGVKYSVNAIDTICSAGEMQAFALYVNSGTSFYQEIESDDDIQYTIRLGASFEISGLEYQSIGDGLDNTFKGIFDGQGYTITIASDITIEGEYAGLFGVLEGTIMDLIVVMNGCIVQGGVDQGVVAAVNNGILRNIAVFINGDVWGYCAVQGASSSGIEDNCWYVINQEAYEIWSDVEPANMLVVRGDGSVRATIEQGELVFLADDCDEILFAGWVVIGTDILDNDIALNANESDNDYFAEFITLNIAKEEQWNNLARIIEEYSYDTTDLNIQLIDDIILSDSFLSLPEFNGTLDGNFHVLNADAMTSENGLIAYSDDASIINLAVIRSSEYAYGALVLSNGECTMFNVVLISPINNIQVGGNAEKIIVGETGDYSTGTVQVLYDHDEEAFVIQALPNFDDDYDLRGFYLDGSRLDNDTYQYLVSKDGGNTILVSFKLRFKISFSLEGILPGESEVNTPSISGAGRYWYQEDEIVLAIEDIGGNYLFRGIRQKDSYEYVDMYDVYTYRFSSELESHQDYVAVFELISFSYMSLEYNATEREQSVDNNNIGHLDVIYTYEGIDGTLYETSQNAPINVGNYMVKAEFKDGEFLIGTRTVGYEITPAPLRVTHLKINDKFYDTTVDATIDGSILIEGLMEGDRRGDISLANIRFAFESSNAGTWRIVVVNNDLMASNNPENDTTYLNYWFGTEIGEVVYIYEGEVKSPTTATINRLEIKIEIDKDLSKIYGEKDPEYSFTYLNDNKPYEGDYFTGSLSREEGEDAGIYKFVDGDLSLSDNYKLEISTINAYLTIIRRKVDFDIQGYEKTYGDTDRTFGIIDISQNETEGLVGNDKLIIKWVYPQNALPNDEAYNVKAIFNPDKNPNYYIESDLTITDEGVTCYIVQSNAYKVNKRPITVNVTGNYYKTYGEIDREIEVTFSNNVFSHYVIAQRVQGEDVGEYEIIFKVISSNNDVSNRYIINANITTYEIAPKPIYVIPQRLSKIYGDDEEPIPWIVDALPTGVEISGDLSREQGNEVGEYNLEIDGLFVSSTNYELRLAASVSKFVIEPKIITITLDDIIKTYGEQDPDKTSFAYTDLAYGDDTTKINLIGIERIAQGEDVGEYSVTGQFSLSGSHSNNYSIEIAPGTLTIKPREILVNISNISFIYGSTSLPEIDIEMVDAPEGITLEDLEITFPNYLANNVGEYNLQPQCNPNYELIYNDATVRITKRTVIVNVSGATKVKGESDPVFEYRIATRGVRADAVAGRIGREAGEGVGEYSLTEGSLRVTSDNYTLVVNLDDAVLVIEKAPIPIVPIAGGVAGGVGVIGLGIGIFFAIKKFKLARIPL